MAGVSSHDSRQRRQRRLILLGGAVVFAAGAAVPLVQGNGDPESASTDPPRTIAPPSADVTEAMGPIASPETTATETTATTFTETTVTDTTVSETTITETTDTETTDTETTDTETTDTETTDTETTDTETTDTAAADTATTVAATTVSASTLPASTVPATTVPATTVPPTTVPASTAVSTTVVEVPLAFGATGDEVVALQTRLTELGFVGPVDGRFGAPTRDAVWAFEKLVMRVPPSQVTGRVTQAMWQQMQPPLQIVPRRRFADGQATQNHTEIYIPEQVVAFFVNDAPVLITHMSSGTSQDWEGEVTIDPGEIGNEDGTAPVVRVEHGFAVTPGGVFTYGRLVAGVRNTALGGMWSPAFFNAGIAIHGALSVPSEPVSHGGVRVPMQFAAVFHQYIAVGDQVFVWDGFKEPEEYGAQPPVPNYVVEPTPTTA